MKQSKATIWFGWIVLAAWLAQQLQLLPAECRECVRADPVTIIATIVTVAVSAGLSYVSGLLTKRPTVERNKTEIKITTARYGEPIKRHYGKMQMGGSAIYRGKITDTVTTTRGSSKRRTPDTVSHSYSTSFGVLVCASDADTKGVIKITADGSEVIYSAAATGANSTLLGYPNGPRHHAHARRLQILLGAEDQLPNAWYEAEYGVGNVPAHRGYVTVWFDDFDLDRFFNRLPNLEFEVEKADGTVLQIVTKECKLGGLLDTDLNLATLTDTIDGLLVSSIQPPRQTIEVLQQARQFVLVEADGKLKGIKLPQPSLAVIPFHHLGAVAGGPEDTSGETPQPRINSTLAQEQEMPREVAVTYFEVARKYERGTQRYARQIYGGKSVLTLDWPLAMLPDDAQRRAKVLAMIAWTEREPFKFTLPPQYFPYHPGDAFTIEYEDGEQQEVRITGTGYAPTEVIEIEAVRQLPEAYEQTGNGALNFFTGEASGIPRVPVSSRIWLSNVFPLADAHNEVEGIYAAVWPYRPPEAGEEWRGAGLFRNRTGTDEVSPDYSYLATFPTAATVGQALTILPAAPAGLDTTSTLRIVMLNGALETISQAAFDNTEDANLIVVGLETLKFKTAVLVAGTTNTYDISYLRRGVRGTANHTGSHESSEICVLFDGAVQRIPLNVSEKGREFNYKVITAGQQIEDELPVPFVFEDLPT